MVDIDQGVVPPSLQPHHMITCDNDTGLKGYYQHLLVESQLLSIDVLPMNCIMYKYIDR